MGMEVMKKFVYFFYIPNTFLTDKQVYLKKENNILLYNLWPGFILLSLTLRGYN